MIPFVDTHVHFWDPDVLDYPWLADHAPLDRRFGPEELRRETADLPLSQLVFVECDAAPDRSLEEVVHVEGLVAAEPRIAGIVAHVPLGDPVSLDATLGVLADHALVRGGRHNLQGQARGYALRSQVVDGVRAVQARGLHFELCLTHDQLDDVVELARRCDEGALVLDHCAKPPIEEGGAARWRDGLHALGRLEHVSCKISGLLTEAGPSPDFERIAPYAEHAVECFGTSRILYGGDWPVLTLAGRYADWHRFTEHLTSSWSDAEREAFYRDNALRVYRL